MQLPVYEISLVVIRCKSSIMSPVTYHCNYDCSCRVTVCIADDFHSVKLGEREHQHSGLTMITDNPATCSGL